MSIKLAMEIPTSMLERWDHLTDLAFVLAHQVLQDSAYAQFYANREKGRELILDNSYHELGEPLTSGELLEAAKRVRADYVITPDRVGDVQFNLEQYDIARMILRPAGFKLAVVMTGSTDGTNEERAQFLTHVYDASMLCLTYKEPKRIQWYKESRLAQSWSRVHLLGLAEAMEARECARVSSLYAGFRNWSLDTAKPLKWAMQEALGVAFDETASLRNARLASKDLLNLKSEQISDIQEYVFKHNVRALRMMLRSR